MSFGSGLGAIIGSNMADNHLDNGLTAVNNTAGNFYSTTAPYNNFGSSFLSPATQGVAGVQDAAEDTKGYDQFMAGYTNTPAAQYQLQQADAVQNNSAAARGGLLSGANNRALATINNGIVSQNANTAYDQYLKGDNQQFGQLETALGNMFKAIGVGQTATGQQAGVTTSQMGNTSNIAQAQAKNDQAKGAGIGSMFDGVSAFAF